MPYEISSLQKNAAPDEAVQSRGYILIEHMGLFLCVEPKSTVTGKRDIYLFFCLGMHDFSIGMITKFDEDEEYT